MKHQKNDLTNITAAQAKTTGTLGENDGREEHIKRILDLVSKHKPVKFLTLKPIGYKNESGNAKSSSSSSSPIAPEFPAPKMEVTNNDEVQAAKDMILLAHRNDLEKPVEEVLVENESTTGHTQENELTHNRNKSNNNFMINQYIRKKLFPKVKFLEKGDPDMEYSNDPFSICQQLCKDCNITSRPNKMLFWDNNKAYLLKKLHVFRNDRMSDLKRHFYGKFLTSKAASTISF